MKRPQSVTLPNGQVIWMATTANPETSPEATIPPDVVSSVPKPDSQPDLEPDLIDLPAQSSQRSPGRSIDPSSLEDDREKDPEKTTSTIKDRGLFTQRHHSVSASQGTQSTSLPSNSSNLAPVNNVGNLIKIYTEYLLKSVKDAAITEINIEKVTLEFGIDLEFGINVPCIASSTATSSIKVALECKLTPPAQVTCPNP